MLLFGLLWLQLVCRVRGYPSGAPTGACVDMYPRHMGIWPQDLPGPHAILANSAKFQPGKPTTVTIVGPDYRGVLLEARTEGNPDALGTWLFPPPDTKLLQCTGKQGAVTHANTNLKGNSTVYTWIPPNIKTPVYFMATVAQQRTVFWVNVRSTFLTNQNLESSIGLATEVSGGSAADSPLYLLLLSVLLMQVLG